MPPKAIKTDDGTGEKYLCTITVALKVLEFIQPDSVLLHCRPLPSE